MVTKILAQVWIPNFSNRLVLSPVERKVQVVGMAKLMSESQEVSERERGRFRGTRVEGLLKAGHGDLYGGLVGGERRVGVQYVRPYVM